MNSMFPMEAARQASVIADAVDDFRPATARWRMVEGWATLETSFVGMDHRAGELTLEYDTSGQGVPEIRDGQHISVCFRRGRGRCAFDTVVLGRGRAVLGSGQRVNVLRLEYPEELCDLQRRAYYRQQVPASAGLTVGFNPVTRNSDLAAPQRVVAGLLDISPQGMSAVLDAGQELAADVDDLVECTLSSEPDALPICLRARVCSRSELSDGRLRVSVQFLDESRSFDANRQFARLLAKVRT